METTIKRTPVKKPKHNTVYDYTKSDWRDMWKKFEKMPSSNKNAFTRKIGNNVIGRIIGNQQVSTNVWGFNLIDLLPNDVNTHKAIRRIFSWIGKLFKKVTSKDLPDDEKATIIGNRLDKFFEEELDDFFKNAIKAEEQATEKRIAEEKAAEEKAAEEKAAEEKAAAKEEKSKKKKSRNDKIVTTPIGTRLVAELDVDNYRRRALFEVVERKSDRTLSIILLSGECPGFCSHNKKYMLQLAFCDFNPNELPDGRAYCRNFSESSYPYKMLKIVSIGSGKMSIMAQKAYAERKDVEVLKPHKLNPKQFTDKNTKVVLIPEEKLTEDYVDVKAFDSIDMDSLQSWELYEGYKDEPEEFEEVEVIEEDCLEPSEEEQDLTLLGVSKLNEMISEREAQITKIREERLRRKKILQKKQQHMAEQQQHMAEQMKKIQKSLDELNS